jgi:hypothetical protein
MCRNIKIGFIKSIDKKGGRKYADKDLCRGSGFFR